jgi:hypothetical protein
MTATPRVNLSILIDDAKCFALVPAKGMAPGPKLAQAMSPASLRGRRRSRRMMNIGGTVSLSACTSLVARRINLSNSVRIDRPGRQIERHGSVFSLPD